MKVYHGSTAIVSQPLVGIGRANLDFGQGFYVTNLRQQAVYWANRPQNNSQPHWLNIYELNLDDIKQEGFQYLRFEAYDYRWLEFVVASRHGEQPWKSYDLIEGGIANDRVFNTIELYSAGLMPREEALEKLRYEKPNNQFCLLNQQMADSHLHFVNTEEVTPIPSIKTTEEKANNVKEMQP